MLDVKQNIGMFLSSRFSGVSQWLGYGRKMKKSIEVELRVLNNAIMRYMDKHSHKREMDKITGTNGWIIGFLAENEDRDVYQKDLEEYFGITRSTASKVIGLMEKKGLVTRLRVSHDARLRKLVLTEEARKLLRFMYQDGKDMEKKLLKGFTEQEMEQLYQYLIRMKSNISS